MVTVRVSFRYITFIQYLVQIGPFVQRFKGRSTYTQHYHKVRLHVSDCTLMNSCNLYLSNYIT